MIKTVKQNGALSNRLTRSARTYQKASSFFLDSFPYAPSEQKYNITLCHEKKFIWFRVAKVGTRTVFDVLRKANIELDAEHPMFCHYPVRKYSNYFKFAFVRNPWDRLVSAWHNKVVDSNYFQFSDRELSQMQQFDSFIDYLQDQDVQTCDQHLRLQTRLIDLNNIDFIGRFEHFEKDVEAVLQALDLGPVIIGRNNSSLNRKDYRECYSEKMMQKAGDIYFKDINLFSYQF